MAALVQVMIPARPGSIATTDRLSVGEGVVQIRQ